VPNTFSWAKHPVLKNLLIACPWLLLLHRSLSQLLTRISRHLTLSPKLFLVFNFWHFINWKVSLQMYTIKSNQKSKSLKNLETPWSVTFKKALCVFYFALTKNGPITYYSSHDTNWISNVWVLISISIGWLTPLLPVSEYIIPKNHALICYFHATLLFRNLPVDCSRAVQTLKTWQVLESVMKKNSGFEFSVSDIISEVGF